MVENSLISFFLNPSYYYNKLYFNITMSYFQYRTYNSHYLIEKHIYIDITYPLDTALNTVQEGAYNQTCNIIIFTVPFLYFRNQCHKDFIVNYSLQYI